MSSASYRTETEKVSAQQLNSNFVRKIEQGRTKEAAEEGSAFIRTKLRQEAFSREILPPVVLGDDELDRDVNSDQPRKIVEKEPDSVATQVITAPAFDSAAFVALMQNMQNRKIPLGKFLMTDATYTNSLALPYTAVGQVASRHYDEGVEKEKKLWGLPVVTTIHNNLVTGHNGGSASVYLFAPNNFLGNFFLLQDATLYIEQKADIISFHAYEAPGIGIGNSFGVSRLDLA
jgi:hypothetical protein